MTDLAATLGDPGKSGREKDGGCRLSRTMPNRL
jgi:hypothetical protein